MVGHKNPAFQTLPPIIQESYRKEDSRGYETMPKYNPNNFNFTQSPVNSDAATLIPGGGYSSLRKTKDDMCENCEACQYRKVRKEHKRNKSVLH